LFRIRDVLANEEANRMNKLILMIMSIMLVSSVAATSVSALDVSAVFVNIPQEHMSPWFHIVDRIATDNGDLRVMVDGGAIITISGDPDVTMPITTPAGQSVDRSEIKEGSKLLMWHEALPPSYPAQATATRVVVL